MLHGSETWAAIYDDVKKLVCVKRSMVRKMCNAIMSEELRSSNGFNSSVKR